jgi:hypothetical protein
VTKIQIRKGAENAVDEFRQASKRAIINFVDLLRMPMRIMHQKSQAAEKVEPESPAQWNS